MKLCSSLPVFTALDLAPAKVTGRCGSWLTLCGKGQHSISYFMGLVQGPIVIWYTRNNVNDEISISQYGEVVASAPEGTLEGSFSFFYSPYDTETKLDEIVLIHRGMTGNSRISVRVDCVQDLCLPDVDPPPSLEDTSIACGKHWHQAGYVRKNTLLLGTKKGYVDVIWSVVGSAEVVFWQGRTILKTITSNRNDVFRFYYDPALGDVYAITQGTGAVDYIATCPFEVAVIEPIIYEFACGDSSPYVFNAPQLTELKLPVRVGTIDLTATVVDTVQLTFMQNQVPFYVLSGHTGTVNFSYEYNPDKGKITVEATGYGQVALSAKCPYTAPDPEPIVTAATCGTTIATYPGYSDIAMDMNGISGAVIVDLIIPDNTTVTIRHSTNQVVTRSGTYNVDYDKSLALVIEGRGTDFQMRVSCPVRMPTQVNLDCGVTRSIESFSDVTVRYGSSIGNSTITSNQVVRVYRDGVLVGVGTSVTFFYPGAGVVLVKCDVKDETLTIDATCPIAIHLPCGEQESYRAGDIIVVDFVRPAIRGHVKITAVITGTVSLAIRHGNTLIRTVTATEEFERILNTTEELRITSSGSGTFSLTVGCAVPIYITGVETLTERINCQTGETAGGIPGANAYITATWTITSYSDGTSITSEKTYDGVCLPVDVPIRPARWGVAMFANRTFTGGPIVSEITDDERMYGVVNETSPSGFQYTHWSGIQAFADAVMTHTFVPSSTDNSVEIETTITVDQFLYIMWDKRAAEKVFIINKGNGFEVEFDGVLWRNDLLGNYEGLPEYNKDLPKYLTVQYDDGTGVRDWVIIRQETTTLAQYSPRTDRYSIKYVKV